MKTTQLLQRGVHALQAAFSVSLSARFGGTKAVGLKKHLPLVAALMAFANAAVLAQNKPFPQQLTYAGCIKPNHVAQAALNASVASYYDYWKSQHLKTGLASLPGGYYVKGQITGSADGYQPLGSSEGQGYGMVITALMAGYDPDAKRNYDGLLKTARAFRSSQNSYLMGWVVADAAGAQGHFSSATDGDMDIAYSLILAHYQWGSAGTYNYLQLAKDMITKGLKVSNVTNNNLRLNLGDWDSKSTFNTRPSDWMLSHMRAFYAVTGDGAWLELINNLYSAYNGFTATYSPTTGLVTDFIINNPAQPCPANFLDEYPETNTYSYNACRFPLRLVMDYALYGTANSKTAAEKIAGWIKGKTGNTPANIRDGYKLDGTVNGGYATAVFVSPLIAAGVTSSANQAWVNSGWEWMKAKKENYYSDSYNLLALLFLSGNWWVPGGATAAPNQAPSASLTGPTANATYPAPATVNLEANATDADGTVSKVEFFQGATLLSTDTSAPYSFAWANVAAGTYTITAKATDNAGAVTTSSAVSITVTGGNGGSCSAPAWVAGTVYVGTNQVSRDGNLYTAKWWTQGNDPITNSCTDCVWKLMGPCGGTARRQSQGGAPVTVYPNPVLAGNQLSVDLGAVYPEAQVLLTDLRGGRLASYSLHNVRNAELTLPAAPQGIFLLEIVAGQNTYFQQVLIK